MAADNVKIIEGKGLSEVQNAIDAWISTLYTGYVIYGVTVCQAGASLESRNVVVAIWFENGAA